MALKWVLASICSLLLTTCHGIPNDPGRPLHRRLAHRSVVVDLGYAVYTGAFDERSGLDVWLGLRYAAAPVGNLRWQPPQRPASDRTPVQASAFGRVCPQAYPGGSPFDFTQGSEDCLFLNVYAPKNVPPEGLPVLVWIHGGGYGFGSGAQDLTWRIRVLILTGSNGSGLVNAGLLDQSFALSWVQDFIGNFGGDPKRVTISGESSGGGSVLLHSIAKDGKAGSKLFQNGIAASPYIPTQWNYNDEEPPRRFYRFAELAGCGNSGAVFDCLVGKDTDALQHANYVSSTKEAPYGEWAFVPVTEGRYITNRPIVLLDHKNVNAVNIFVGNNANEGGLFANNPGAPLLTESAVRSWLPEHFPNLNATDINNILAAYPAADAQSDVRQETNGLTAPYANNVSQDAVGQQQRANNIYAESTFVCPSYWLASAFTGAGKSAYHYQYSVPFAEHQADINAYFGPASANQGPDFVLAFRRMWGNFIAKGNPSISNAEANGAAASAQNIGLYNPASDFPLWTDTLPKSMNLNETGGITYNASSLWQSTVTQYRGASLRNHFSIFDSYLWEAGRGQRCELWKSLAPKILK